MLLVYHVIPQDHVIKGSPDLWVGAPQSINQSVFFQQNNFTSI